MKRSELQKNIIEYLNTQQNLEDKRERYVMLKNFVDKLISFQREEVEDSLNKLHSIIPMMMALRDMKDWKRKKWSKEVKFKEKFEECFNMETECWMLQDFYKTIK